MRAHMQRESTKRILARIVRPAAIAPLLCLIPWMDHAQTSQTDITTPIQRFEGSAQFKGKGGKTQNASVTIRQWTIPGKQKMDVPERGFLLVTLRAGKVTTTIDGKEEKRRTDDFWTVAENAKMSVEAAGEAAILEVISFTVR